MKNTTQIQKITDLPDILRIITNGTKFRIQKAYKARQKQTYRIEVVHNTSGEFDHVELKNDGFVWGEISYCGWHDVEIDFCTVAYKGPIEFSSFKEAFDFISKTLGEAGTKLLVEPDWIVVHK